MSEMQTLMPSEAPQTPVFFLTDAHADNRHAISASALLILFNLFIPKMVDGI